MPEKTFLYTFLIVSTGLVLSAARPAGCTDRLPVGVDDVASLWKQSDLPHMRHYEGQSFHEEVVPEYDYFDLGGETSYHNTQESSQSMTKEDEDPQESIRKAGMLSQLRDLKHDIDIIETMPGFLSRMIGLVGQATRHGLQSEEDDQANQTILMQTLDDVVPEGPEDDLKDAEANRLRVEYLYYESARQRGATKKGPNARRSETYCAREAATRLMQLRERYHQLKDEAALIARNL